MSDVTLTVSRPERQFAHFMSYGLFESRSRSWSAHGSARSAISAGDVVVDIEGGRMDAENGPGENKEDSSPLSASELPASEEKRGPTCFVISAIGSRDSDIRKRSDAVLDFVIKPAVQDLGYLALRADAIAEPGLIIQQVINAIAEAELVVADITYLNPNVFYELAVRHHTGKPMVIIAEQQTQNPFDVNQVRTIYFDHTDLRSVDACKKEIQITITAMSQPGFKQDNPILQANRYQEIMASKDPGVIEQLPLLDTLTTIQQQLQTLNSRVGRIEAGPRMPQGGSGYEYSLEDYLDTRGAESGYGHMNWRLRGSIEALIRALRIKGVNAEEIEKFEFELDRLFDARNLEALQSLERNILGLLHNSPPIPTMTHRGP